jgi:sortase B
MGVTATVLGRQAIKIANSIVNLAVLVLVLLLVAFSCYALWDSNQLHAQASAAQYEIYKPTIEDEGASFAELVAINDEVFAWLTVYGTHIDYPVAQGEDNWKYVSTDVEGKYSMSGAIFLDCANSRAFTDFNSIFYGHHMEKNAMFGDLGLFSDKGYFNERQYGNLYFGGKDHGIEFFAFLHVDAYDSSVFAAAIEGEEYQQQYLDGLYEKAMYTRDVGGVTIEDRIVLLSTCSSSSTNGRDILVGRLTDQLYEDTFISDITDERGPAAAVDEQDGGWWADIPLWGWGGLAALPILLLVFVLVNRGRKQKKRVRKAEEQAPAEQENARFIYRSGDD